MQFPISVIYMSLMIHNKFLFDHNNIYCDKATQYMYNAHQFQIKSMYKIHWSRPTSAMMFSSASVTIQAISRICSVLISRPDIYKHTTKYTKSVAKAPYFVLIHKKLMPLNQIGNTIYTERCKILQS